jgi:hypothetical protein
MTITRQELLEVFANEDYNIVPISRHDGDGVTTEYSVTSWGVPGHSGPGKWHDGFESLEAAAKWMETQGKTPPIRNAERRRLDHMLGALGDESPLTPDDLAEVIADAYDIAKLARFAVKFRQAFEEKVMRINPFTGLQAAPYDESPF